MTQLATNTIRSADVLVAFEPAQTQPLEPGSQPHERFRTIGQKVIKWKIELTEHEKEYAARWIRDRTASGFMKELDVIPFHPETMEGEGDSGPLFTKIFDLVCSRSEQLVPSDEIDVRDTVMILASCQYHHDLSGFPDNLFCVVWMSDETGLDLVFPDIGERVPLGPGVVVLFDPSQPHGVLRRDSSEYHKTDYDKTARSACYSLEIPVYLGAINEALGIEFRADTKHWKGIVVEPDDNDVDINETTGAWEVQRKSIWPN